MTDFQTKQPSVLPAVAQYLKVLNEQVIPMLQQTGSVFNAINARDGLAKLTQAFVTEYIDVPLLIDELVMFEGSDTSTGYDVPVRIYHPNPTETLPCLVYFHGGGSVAGSVSVYDGILRRIAKHTQHIVIAPGYRLAPENPYPAGLTDGKTVLLGLHNLLARRQITTTGDIVLVGDSHGGAMVTNLLRDSEVQASNVWHKLTAQVLIYPSVDFSMSCDSIDKYAQGYLLSRERIEWYFEQYFKHGEDRQMMSALFATNDELAGQPPALIFNALFDPLYDEGVAYAKKLTEAGVQVSHIEFDGVIHAYLNMENLNPEICQQTYQAMAGFLDG